MTSRELLERHFGFTDFRAGQLDVIEALERSGRALAVFPTGGGKSICYQLPALTLDGVTLVVSPLIALMKDQIDFLKRRGISAARLDSTIAPEEARAVAEEMNRGALKLLYVAPERFNNERFLETLGRTKIALFAIDEAHCISEWGHNFRPDYLKLAQVARDLGAARVLALTATATPAVVRDICEAFAIPPSSAIVTGFYRSNLRIKIHPVPSAERDEALLTRIAASVPGPTIVYVTLQKTAEQIAAKLARAGYPAEAYHAGMESEARDAVQDRWMKSDRGIVVATIAFGMGIDKSSVRYVYHYNLPKSLESYSQEIGRAGRDGEAADVTLFANHDDVATLENFAFGDTPAIRGLRGLVEELLSLGTEFQVSHHALSERFDLRPLVLRTALTYLELGGVLRQRTPAYAGYKVRPLKPLAEVIGAFRGEPARFLSRIFENAKAGRTWFTLDPEAIARTLEQDRARVVRALEVVEERGLAEIAAADLRHRYARQRPSEDVEALVADLAQRFARREDNEIDHIRQVLALAESATCHANALAAHFGEVRTTPCGLCVPCEDGGAARLPERATLPALPADLDVARVREVRLGHPSALGDPRQAARWLVGLTSPATTRAKLSRHSLFGALNRYSFAQVLAWCAEEETAYS